MSKTTFTTRDNGWCEDYNSLKEAHDAWLNNKRISNITFTYEEKPFRLIPRTLWDIENSDTPKRSAKMKSMLSPDHQKNDVVWFNESLGVLMEYVMDGKVSRHGKDRIDCPEMLLDVYYDKDLFDAFPPKTIREFKLNPHAKIFVPSLKSRKLPS